VQGRLFQRLVDIEQHGYLSGEFVQFYHRSQPSSSSHSQPLISQETFMPAAISSMELLACFLIVFLLGVATRWLNVRWRPSGCCNR
jgi:hypothetical protein